MKLKVNEIFISIQGESTFAGLPCVFVRLCGCNLRCTYCDTIYAYEEGNYIEISKINNIIKDYGIDLVCITGGEPLLQNATAEFISGLCEGSYTVLIETNGSLRIDCLPEKAIRILDIKCPDSAMSDKMDWSNIPLLKPNDEVKFVISSRSDYEWAKDVICKYRLLGKVKLLLSAVEKMVTPNILAQWILEDKLNVRLQVQLHKYLSIK